ncbi:DUF4951 domain-containing protein [Acinetobacter terrestris]|uniref:DUF4951 domain-containing protein n=1 Tax=Acinetobacter terrestris TaxID=2529843 RepID=UPI003617A0F8
MINRYKKLKTSDIFTLERVQTWQKFYENETECNPDNPTTPVLAQLMKRLPNFAKFSNLSNHTKS